MITIEQNDRCKFIVNINEIRQNNISAIHQHVAKLKLGKCLRFKV
jgi:hypothetical protein